MGLAGGLNLYRYAPNPLSWIDPLGLCKTGPNEYTGQGYHNVTYAAEPVKPKDAVGRWDNLLDPGPHTHIHPRTGLLDLDRIVSVDGTRSTRYGNHKMNVNNSVVRVPLPK